MRRSSRPGFTLVDLILSLSIIAILLAIILIQFKPGERIFNANLTVANKNAQAMEKAMELYMSETGEDPGDDEILDGKENMKYVCNYGLSPAEKALADCIHLDELVDEGYLPELPPHFDWTREDDDDRVTGYTVYWSGGDPIFGGPRPPASLAFMEPTSVMTVADNDVSVDFDGPFTLVFWMKSDAIMGNADFFRKMNTAGTKGIRVWRSDQGIGVQMHSDLNHYLYLSGGGTFLGEIIYRMITITYDGSGSSGGLYYCLDYRECNQSSNPGTLNGSIEVTDDLRIGGGSSQAFDGLIDDIKIYDRVLERSEIDSLYADSKEVTGGPPVHHWKFDEGYGSTARDSRTGVMSPLTDVEWSEEVQLSR